MYLNAVQLAESFGVAESVVEGWIREEALPCVRDGHRTLFDRAQVMAWAAERGLATRAGFLAPERARGGAEGRIERWLRAGGIWRDVAAADVRVTLERIGTALPGVTPAVRELLAKRIHADDGMNWAPVGHGLALPHLRAHVALGWDAGVVALLFLRESLPLSREETPDDTPITRLIFFMAPSPRAHLDLLARLSAGFSCGRLGDALVGTATDAEIFSAVGEVDAAGGAVKPAPR